jgi:hypothetical protein
MGREIIFIPFQANDDRKGSVRLIRCGEEPRNSEQINLYICINIKVKWYLLFTIYLLLTLFPLPSSLFLLPSSFFLLPSSLFLKISLKLE